MTENGLFEVISAVSPSFCVLMKTFAIKLANFNDLAKTNIGCTFF